MVFCPVYPKIIMLKVQALYLVLFAFLVALNTSRIRKSVKRLVDSFWNLDVSKLPGPVFDLYIFLVTRGLPTRHQYVRGQDRLHETRGRTFTVNQPTSVSIYTIDAENIRTVWSTRFDDWEVGPIRFPVVGAFVGRGIVTTDGNRWTDVRQVAKHALARDIAVDFQPFKSVANKYVASLPSDEHEVDLQPFFFDMVFATQSAVKHGC